jgi:hypothetical protein
MTRTFLNLTALAALVCFGCAPPPPGGIYYASGEGSITPEGLHLLDWEPFRATWVRPGADLQRYDRVLVEEVTISYEKPPRTTRFRGNRVGPNYALSDAALESMKRDFREAFTRSLGRSRYFSVTNAPGPDVLLISGQIFNLRITVPPVAQQDPEEYVYRSSRGRMTLALDARDSESGEPLVRVGQTRFIEASSGGWYKSDSASTSWVMREIFRSWASDLRRELDDFRSLPELPPVPPTHR